MTITPVFEKAPTNSISRPTALNMWWQGLTVLGLALVIQPIALGQDENSSERVGDWTCERDITLAVASRFASDSIAYVFGSNNTLHLTRSTDGGETWSEPAAFATGTAPNVAIDSNDVVHVVYLTKPGTCRVHYRQIGNGEIGDVQDLTAVVVEKDAKYWAPKIAVDGRDNVHILYWSGGFKEEKAARLRTAYCYKPATSTQFLPTELWRDKAATGYAKYGTITLDGDGNVHLFYASASAKPNSTWSSHGLERRVRNKDGRWGEHSRWESSLLADWSMSALIDGDGVAHVATQKKIDGEWRLLYLNNRVDRGVLAPVTDFGIEPTETYADLAFDSAGNIFLATGHRQGPKNHDAQSKTNIGTFCRRDAFEKTWSDREPLSQPGFLNVGARQSGHPRFCNVNGTLQIFYAESEFKAIWTHHRRFMAR